MALSARACGIISWLWVVNSAVECHLHTVEVSGSIPLRPTTYKKALMYSVLFLFQRQHLA
jgi:hypothetical protein